MLGDGWHNVGRWVVQRRLVVGLLLVQRRLVVVTTLACGMHNVGL